MKTVLLKNKKSGDVYAARLDSSGKVTAGIGPLHQSDYAAALAGEADTNMHTQDNEYLNSAEFELYK